MPYDYLSGKRQQWFTGDRKPGENFLKRLRALDKALELRWDNRHRYWVLLKRLCTGDRVRVLRWISEEGRPLRLDSYLIWVLKRLMIPKDMTAEQQMNKEISEEEADKTRREAYFREECTRGLRDIQKWYKHQEEWERSRLEKEVAHANAARLN